MTIHNSPTQTITIPANSIQIIGWPLTAVTAGKTDLTIQASINDDIMDAVQLPLNIRPLAIPDVTTEVGQFRGQLLTTVDMPADALPLSSTRIGTQPLHRRHTVGRIGIPDRLPPTAASNKQ